jgi:hypothetical protein
MNLWSDFLTNNQRLIRKWAHYFPAYERHFSRFRNQSITMVEIGIADGGSLQMWKRYFGPFAQIVGVDITPDCKAFEDEQTAVRIGDQSDPAFLAGIVEEFGPIDIVLDDGSHRMHHMLASFEHLYPRLQRNGVFAVEDLHTCYWSTHGGGYKAPTSFIEHCKDLIDQLNAGHRGAVEPTDFARMSLSMHFYDSMVFFEKGRHLNKVSLRARSGWAKPGATAPDWR